MSVFPRSRLFIKCGYLGNEIGETQKFLLTDDTTVPINHEFNLTVDKNSSKDLDLLISNPITCNKKTYFRKIVT